MNSVLMVIACITRLDRNRHGGGVALYVGHNLPHNIIFIGSSNFECIIITVHVGSCKVSVCVVYRPPSSGTAFLDSLCLEA